MREKTVCLILALLLMLPLCAACGESAENSDGETASAPVTTDPNDPQITAETEEELTLATLADSFGDRNYNGKTFRILDRGSGYWMTVDVTAEEMTGEIINDSIFERNSLLEEKLNVSVAEIGADSPSGTLRTSVTAMSDDYDVATDGLNQFTQLVGSNMLFDYREVPGIVTQNRCWDQLLISGTSVMNKVFYMTGDVSIMDNYGTWCMMFNKDILADNGLESPYELVREGNWTLDRLSEMASAATLDLNGDGRWTAADQYGFVSEGYNTYGLYMCCGQRITDKDEDDLPVFVYTSEQSVDALAKCIEVQFSDFCNVKINPNLSRENQFSSGGGLFYLAGMINITAFRDSETNFGVIPAPKLNEEQDRYYSTYSPWNLTVYTMPTTLSDPAASGDIFEAMAELSAFSLTPAYYDITLMYKAVRDEESGPMIELILNSRNFDLGSIYDWGNTATTIRGLNNTGNIASTLQRMEKVANKTLEKFIKALEG